MNILIFSDFFSSYHFKSIFLDSSNPISQYTNISNIDMSYSKSLKKLNPSGEYPIFSPYFLYTKIVIDTLYHNLLFYLYLSLSFIHQTPLLRNPAKKFFPIKNNVILFSLYSASISM